MAQSQRLARLQLLLGDDGLSALAESTVMVLGLGGVGSACAEALARGGVGTLVLLDGDVVEESNINRQAVAYVSTLGRAKTDVMAQMVADINPECVAHTRQVFMTPANVVDTLDGCPRPDYVIDCIDTLTQKLQIAEWCAERGVPLVASMGAANKLDPCRLEFADVQHTELCAMSRVMRRECRRRGLSGVEVLFSREPTAQVHRGDGRSKADTLGSMSYMPPIMGKMLAGVVIRRLSGLEAMPTPPQLHPPSR